MVALIAALVSSCVIGLVFLAINIGMRRGIRADVKRNGTEIAERRAESIRRAQQALDAVEWRNQLQRYALRRRGLLPADPAADAAWQAMSEEDK